VLILTRRIDESIVIDEKTTVTVLGIKGNQVRLGVAAPKDVTVHREDIFERILAERRRAIDVCDNVDVARAAIGSCVKSVTGAGIQADKSPSPEEQES